MRNIISTVFILLIYTANAQEDVKSLFKKYPVESTGCMVYLPAPPGEWTAEKSVDSSDVYTATVESEGMVFDAIVVQFKEPFTNLSAEEKEDILVSYLDYLQDAIGVYMSDGYEKGQSLSGFPNVTGIADYWEFDDGTQGKVKGWISDTHLAVLVVSADDDPSGNTATDTFLDGFRFPGK